MLSIAQVLSTVAAQTRHPAEAAELLGSSLLAAARAGVLGLSGQQLVLALAMAGETGPETILPVVRAEWPTIVRLVDSSMSQLFPRVRYGGKVYAWSDAKGDARTFAWYLAACSMADAELAERALSAALAGFGLDGEKALVIYGQDPVTICIVIVAILGLATALIGLASAASPYVLPLVFPPKQAASAGQKAPDAGSPRAGGMMNPILLLVLLLLFLDGSGKKAA